MSERLDALFASSHGLDRRTLDTLALGDLDELREVARGLRESPNRSRALNAVAILAGPDAPAVLGEVLNAPDEDPGLRAVAAASLARSGLPEAETILLDALPTATSLLVRARIAAALGKVGTVFSLDELEALADDPEPAVRQQAAFSRVLAAYRIGIPGIQTPAPEPDQILELETGSEVPFAIRQASREETGAAMTALSGDTFGVDLSDRAGFQIECGPARMFLVLSEDLARLGAAGMSRRSMVAGLVARRAPADGSLSVALVVLAGPQGDGGFHVAVYRGDGRQSLYGSGTVHGDGGDFELRSVKGRGNVAAFLRGRIQRQAVAFTEARSAARTTERGVPRPLEP